MGKGSRDYFLPSGWLLHYNVIIVLFWDVNHWHITAQMIFGQNSSLTLKHLTLIRAAGGVYDFRNFEQV